MLIVIEHLEKTIFGHNCPLHIHSTVSTPFMTIVIKSIIDTGNYVVVKAHFFGLDYESLN